MTRYAKLSGRKPEASKSTAQEEAEESEKRVVKTDTDKDDEKDVDNSGDGERMEPKEKPKNLFKKIKLLKFKIENAKTPEKKEKLENQLKELRGHDEGSSKQPQKQQRKNESKSISNSGTAAPSSSSSSSTHVEQIERTKASEGLTNPWKVMEAERRAKSAQKSAQRREKRALERESSLRCFDCREFGHSAKNCPKEMQGDSGNEIIGKKGKEDVCCYRCGSLQHSLAKCRKPAPTQGPELPFANCFICQQRGHLASKCSKNQGKGIYPNGGCCKICKSVDHLAKNCSLNEVHKSGGTTAASTASIGLADLHHNSQTGADEDDFHAFSRKRIQTDSHPSSRDFQHQQTAKRPKVVSF